MRTLVFTDLDGTLLSHDSYSWEAARPAIDELRRRRIPLVFCTSKTRAEVRSLRKAIGNSDPFIVENGGVVVIPAHQSTRTLPLRKKRGRTLLLGQPYQQVVATLRKMARKTGVRVRGFHQMNDKEVADRTGLSLRQAALARQRETGEPFLLQDATQREIRSFTRVAHEVGYTVQRGGRFWHLSAGCDKGLALSAVVSYFRMVWNVEIRTIGLGNNANDLPMLQLVHLPILMPLPGGDYDSEVTKALPRVECAPEPGPAGWAQAVLRALSAAERTRRRPSVSTSSKDFDQPIHFGA
jgi:mannosyl-3-phosphoglycerate phosphatase